MLSQCGDDIATKFDVVDKVRKDGSPIQCYMQKADSGAGIRMSPILRWLSIHHAMPGKRLYLDLRRTHGCAILDRRHSRR